MTDDHTEEAARASLDALHPDPALDRVAMLQAAGVSAFLDTLADVVADAPKLLASEAPGAALAELGQALLGLRFVRDRLRELEDALEAEVARVLYDVPGRLLPVEGWGVVQAKWNPPGRSLTEDDRLAMARRVYAHALDHRVVSLSGEVESPAEAVLRCLTEAFRLEPRSTALKGMGVDPKEYGEARTQGRYSARLLTND